MASSFNLQLHLATNQVGRTKKKGGPNCSKAPWQTHYHRRCLKVNVNAFEIKEKINNIKSYGFFFQAKRVMRLRWKWKRSVGCQNSYMNGLIRFNTTLAPSHSVSAVPPQRLSHRPLHADGNHHGAQTDVEQFHGARPPVSSPMFLRHFQMASHSVLCTHSVLCCCFVPGWSRIGGPDGGWGCCMARACGPPSRSGRGITTCSRWTTTGSLMNT